MKCPMGQGKGHYIHEFAVSWFKAVLEDLLQTGPTSGMGDTDTDHFPGQFLPKFSLDSIPAWLSVWVMRASGDGDAAGSPHKHFRCPKVEARES